jgi:periplasmic divalent cation tolerance protein
METEYAMVIITAPEEEAAAIASTMVEKKLAACAQVSCPITSYFWWEGKIDTEKEVHIFLKTRTNLVPAITETLTSIHSYEVPECITIPIAGGNPEYLAWLADVLS